MVRCSRFVCFAVLVAMTILQSPMVAAAELTYSWSGTLVLADNSSPDPWSIGDDGAAFTMWTAVDTGALDGNSAQTPFAIFPATSARLWVDGQEASLVGTPWIDFTDSTDILDAVTMAGDFSKDGQVVSFSTVVALSPLTYTFDSQIEVPPLFPSMQSISLGTDRFLPYVAIVPAGTLVSVVPEPAALGLAGVALIGWIAGSRRWVPLAYRQ